MDPRGQTLRCAVAMRQTLEELHSLSQWQFTGVVDGVGGTTHISLPCIGAGFTAAAGFLLTAECATDFRTGGTDVDVSDTAVRAGGRQEDLCFRVVFGKDSRGQPLWNRVVQRDGLRSEEHTSELHHVSVSYA